MTYNLLGAQGDAAVFSEHAGWAARIDQLRPGVLVLQEAQSDDVAAVLGLTTTGYSLAAYRWWDCDSKGNPEGVAILVRDDLTVTGGGSTVLGSSCTDPSMERVLVWADLDVGGPLRVYGTHLTAGGGAAAGSRAAQITALRARIAADLNLTPGTAEYRALLGTAGGPAPGEMVDTLVDVSPVAATTSVCPSWSESDPAAQPFLLSHPESVRACGYTAGWAKDTNPLTCEVLSLCVAWEVRRDTSVRIRIDDVLRAAGGPVRTVRAFVPHRDDPDWASPGAEWFRLSDHLPYVADLEVTPLGSTGV